MCKMDAQLLDRTLKVVFRQNRIKQEFGAVQIMEHRVKRLWTVPRMPGLLMMLYQNARKWGLEFAQRKSYSVEYVAVREETVITI